MKLPAQLTIEPTCIFPRWICNITDNKGTANGGFWKGFKTHAEMSAWLGKNGYSQEG